MVVTFMNSPLLLGGVRTPPIPCMNLKTKRLQNGFHVSARKERGDFIWGEGEVSSKMGMETRRDGRRSPARVQSIIHML
jgi:hypothetical protein